MSDPRAEPQAFEATELLLKHGKQDHQLDGAFIISSI